MFKPEKFIDKTACVLGAGKSGIYCANLLAGKGFKVILSEEKTLEQLGALPQQLLPAVTFETGGHSDKLFDCGFAVKSPGISSSCKIIAGIKSADIPLFSELETALSFCPNADLFAVTGTNGKTTTTTLLWEILRRKESAHAHLCGNIGVPVSSICGRVKTGDDIALEISSYQLEDCSYFKPDCACVLNITPDHIDRHESMENYINVKSKIFQRQKKTDFCIFNAQDEICVKLSKECPSRALFFSSSLESSDIKLNAFIKNGEIIFNLGGCEISAKPPEISGEHNLQNAMAAGLMALCRGADISRIRTAFAEFKGVEHRLEEAGTARGLRCINDSKATNVDSTMTALRALSREGRKIWLIMGGRGKKSPYTPLMPLLQKSVLSILAIGEDAEKVRTELEDAVPVIDCETLEKAVLTAITKGSKGDILLLSPACASFDQFRDYEDRGRQFKEMVRRWKTVDGPFIP